MNKQGRLAAVITLAFTMVAHAQSDAIRGSVMLGGGYLEDPGRGYGFLQLRGTFYEDDAFAHTVFLEYLGHTDDAVLEFGVPGMGGFIEDGDILFSNITLNYELEAKLGSAVSVFAGAGAGIELVNLDDRFNFNIDSDSNFVAQAFAGIRADFGSFWGQLGVRYVMRDDVALLGDQFVTNDSAAYELSVGFKF